jgi:hypothetical protein
MTLGALLHRQTSVCGSLELALRYFSLLNRETPVVDRKYPSALRIHSDPRVTKLRIHLNAAPAKLHGEASVARKSSDAAPTAEQASTPSAKAIAPAQRSRLAQLLDTGRDQKGREILTDESLFPKELGNIVADYAQGEFEMPPARGEELRRCLMASDAPLPEVLGNIVAGYAAPSAEDEAALKKLDEILSQWDACPSGASIDAAFSLCAHSPCLQTHGIRQALFRLFAARWHEFEWGWDVPRYFGVHELVEAARFNPAVFGNLPKRLCIAKHVLLMRGLFELGTSEVQEQFAQKCMLHNNCLTWMPVNAVSAVAIYASKVCASSPSGEAAREWIDACHQRLWDLCRATPEAMGAYVDAVLEHGGSARFSLLSGYDPKTGMSFLERNFERVRNPSPLRAYFRHCAASPHLERREKQRLLVTRTGPILKLVALVGIFEASVGSNGIPFEEAEAIALGAVGTRSPLTLARSAAATGGRDLVKTLLQLCVDHGWIT